MISIEKIFAFGVVDNPSAGEERPDRAQVERVKAWLDESATKARTYPPFITSYTIKHRVERNRGAFNQVSNGAAIVALIECGYTVRRTTPNSPNVDVKIKFKKGSR